MFAANRLEHLVLFAGRRREVVTIWRAAAAPSPQPPHRRRMMIATLINSFKPHHHPRAIHLNLVIEKLCKHFSLETSQRQPDLNSYRTAAALSDVPKRISTIFRLLFANLATFSLKLFLRVGNNAALQRNQRVPDDARPGLKAVWTANKNRLANLRNRNTFRGLPSGRFTAFILKK